MLPQGGSLGVFSTSAFKLLPTELPGGTPKSEFQRAATDGFLEYLPLPGTESVRIFQF
jgi:hypothetical protein